MSSPFDDKLMEYMHSRLIFSENKDGKACGIIVDGFRFLHAHERYILSQALAHEHPGDSSGIAKHSSITSKKFSVSHQPTRMPWIFYFLSHFHSDHYTGLSPSWNRGKIFCSAPTAAAVVHSLGVSPEYVCPLEIGKIYQGCLSPPTTASVFFLPELRLMEGKEAQRSLGVSSVHEDIKGFDEASFSMCWSAPSPLYFSVRLICANHCPGAVMFLFYLPSCGYIIHTGDFRFEADGMQKPPLSPELSTAYNTSLDGENTAGEGKVMKTSIMREGIDESDTTQQVISEKKYGQKKLDDIKSNALQKISSRRGTSAVAYEDTVITDDPYVRAACGKVHTLFLDNTYGAPCFEFPPQKDAAQVVVEEVAELLWERLAYEAKRISSISNEKNMMESSLPRCLTFHTAILAGSYTLGKERLVLELLNIFSELSTARLCDGEAESRIIWACPKKVALLNVMNAYEKHFRSWEVLSVPQESTSLSSGKIKISNLPAAGENINIKAPSGNADLKAQNKMVNIISAQPSVCVPLVALLEYCEKVKEKINDFSSSAFMSVQHMNEVFKRSTVCITILLVPMVATRYPFLHQGLTHGSFCVSKSPLSIGWRESMPDGNSTQFFTQAPTSAGSSFVNRGGASLLNVQEDTYLNLSDFHFVIAVEPTGWVKTKKRSIIHSKRPSLSLLSITHSTLKSTPYAVVRLSLPYSEHSSFSKILEFVRFLNPQRIIPTVDKDLFKKYEFRFMEEAPRLISSFGCILITRFLSVDSISKKKSNATPSTSISSAHVNCMPNSENSTSTDHASETSTTLGDVNVEVPLNNVPCGGKCSLVPQHGVDTIEYEKRGRQLLLGQKEEEASSLGSSRKNSITSANLQTFFSPSLMRSSRMPHAFVVEKNRNTNSCSLVTRENSNDNSEERKFAASPESVVVKKVDGRGGPSLKRLKISSGRSSLSSNASNSQSRESDCVFLGKEEVVHIISSDDDDRIRDELPV